MPHKKTSFNNKLSILQLNQATFDLPGSAIIRPSGTENNTEPQSGN